MLPMLDFVNVNFYNNEAQETGGSDLEVTVKSWAEKLAAVSPARSFSSAS